MRHFKDTFRSRTLFGTAACLLFLFFSAAFPLTIRAQGTNVERGRHLFQGEIVISDAGRFLLDQSLSFSDQDQFRGMTAQAENFR